MRLGLFALLLLGVAACRRDVHVLARRPPPAPAAPVSPARDPWISSPVEEHDDYVLDVRVRSNGEIVAAIKNEDRLRVARTTDEGRTWAYAPVEVPGPQLYTAYFVDEGATLYVLAMNGAASPHDARVRVGELTFTSSS